MVLFRNVAYRYIAGISVTGKGPGWSTGMTRWQQSLQTALGKQCQQGGAKVKTLGLQLIWSCVLMELRWVFIGK